MEDLFIWYCTLPRRGKGVPQHGDTWIREKFSYGKEIEGLNYEWVNYDYLEHGFPPMDTKLLLPDELYFIIQRQKKLVFDFLPYRKNLFIISEKFKFFIETHLSDKPLEFARLKVVHKNNKEFLNEKKYYLLRVILFDDDLFDFIEEGKKRAAGLRGEFIYPSLILKNDVRQEIFFLDSFCYQESILFTGKIKDIIKAQFFRPEIYKIEDFYLAFNNNSTSRSEHLPAIV